MEMAQFGDTDVSASELKSHIEKMKGYSDGKTISRLQEEFEVSLMSTRLLTFGFR